jgi:8-oxo-dGTP pyrophosphatase MutT (NUDIX family)
MWRGRGRGGLQDNRQYREVACTNCGIVGHAYRNCMAPVNSYGIIAFRVRNPEWSLSKILCSSVQPINGLESTVAIADSGISRAVASSGIEFLLIRRKDSLRFVEFVRGKYDLNDELYLKQMLGNMTQEEREFLRATTFDDLWKRVWGSGQTKNYKNDFEISRQKFEMLMETGMLQRLLNETSSPWTEPEWGFPKGRRNPRESDISCAMREFGEETGLNEMQYKVIGNMDPLQETFYGDNGVHYCHKYYLAQVDANETVGMDMDNPHMAREISGIVWLPVEEALKKIRSENVEKREVLLRASGILRAYCVG